MILMTLFCYDIFKRDDRVTLVWIEAAVDLENAKSRILELSAQAPGQYVVVNQATGRMVATGTVVASPGAGARAPRRELETLWK